MKMVKSLLLGSAAAVVAVASGQAADLPVKAKPVEYVKICSLYGAGFYYMPGTEMCIKIGGWVRAEITDYGAGNFSTGATQGDLNNRTTSNLSMRARGYITADAREQTAYGTARAYISAGVATTDIGNTLLPSALGLNRAFIQFAGMTAGETQSFYDFYSVPATSYRGYFGASDTGDPGWWLWAYTAQLGNGLSATVSAEQRRAAQMIDLTSGTSVGTLAASTGGAAAAGSLTGDLANPAAGATNAPGSYGGDTAPDVVATLRLDQSWGSAQVMGALHQDNAAYYGTVPATGGPSDKWGFVVGGGLRLNFPMVAQGDYFQSQVNYTVGAPRYTMMSNNAPTLANGQGNTVAYGVFSDCVYGATGAGVAGAGPGPAAGGTGCNLTTAFGVNAAYEHYWTPQFRESFVYAYNKILYNSQANAILCNFEVNGAAGGATGGAAAVPVANCNNNWAISTYATRFQYDFTKSLYLGVEVMYQHFTTAQLPGSGGGVNTIGAPLATLIGGGLSSNATVKNENNVAITARIHKDFLP
jgi:hypothetical protein